MPRAIATLAVNTTRRVNRGHNLFSEDFSFGYQLVPEKDGWRVRYFIFYCELRADGRCELDFLNAEVGHFELEFLEYAFHA